VTARTRVDIVDDILRAIVAADTCPPGETSAARRVAALSAELDAWDAREAREVTP